ncbi:uncharacterized protein N7484_000459 [Penicillium longicatenatum]|uniref:uncharacterized protein n=1 Tax=Penicillium longicatenatum TaxID=1561947 RepID=UPI002548A398|nr:uncharacterized protein N7484_000459 [Penicillium longicatenatum]KAJ5661087.1 hypothetical protein N7484_000459 [Penicillium longicatenatum]
MLVVGRLINGFGGGLLTAIFPVYASEVAPPSIRGAFGGLQMVMIETAIFVATATGYAFGIHYSNDAQWRGPLAVQALPLQLLIPVTFFLPETPRWLVRKGKEEQALRVLGRLYNSDITDHVIRIEFGEIKRHIEAEEIAYNPSWKEIATRPSWRRRAVLSMALQFFPKLQVSIVFNTMLSVLSAVYQGKAHPNANALRAEVAMFFLFQLAFVAVGMLAWLIPPEMCPMAIRAKVNSVSVSVNNISGLIVAQVGPIGLGGIGFKFFYVFVALNIVGVVFYLLFIPETSGLTLEEMDVQFGDQIVDFDEEDRKGTPICSAQHQESA